MMGTDGLHMWGETIPVPSVKALGNALSHRRHALNLSQKSIGEKTGLLPSAISRIELESDDDIPFGVVMKLVAALDLDLELRPRGSKFTPRPPTKLSELGLSSPTTLALKREGLEDITQLGSATSMLSRPEFRSGVELYEIFCALSRYGISYRGRVPDERNREIFRLRIVDGLMLTEIARRYTIDQERVRQILNVFFGLTGSPPAASLRRKQKARRRQQEP
jgi:transcriptional regulator with XRE-family HTH domain